ncbi:hypothetical protein D3C76_738420 [compost metagenome]
MPGVQPLIGQVDARIGHVREVATRLHQIGLAGQVAPDDPHLMTRTLTTQRPCELIVCFGGVHGGANLRAHLARGEAAVEFTGLHQRQQQKGVTHTLFGDEVAGSGDASELRPAFRGPGAQPMVIVQGADRGTERLLGTGDKRQENGGQVGKRRQAHGLSLIGV